jgi:hypothetical protein
MIWESGLLMTVLKSDDRKENEEMEGIMRYAHHRLEHLAGLLASGLPLRSRDRLSEDVDTYFNTNNTDATHEDSCMPPSTTGEAVQTR